MTDLPRKAVARSAKLATLPLGYAGRTALGLGKRIGGKPAEAVAAELQLRTAEQLFAVLGELKGGAMKVGQAMSILEAAMPEEMAEPYRVTLTRLQEAAPPLPARDVHAVLAEQLGRRWRSKFESFDDNPAAAASIGQVHRAVWADGRPVAVKIQYPGAAEALTSDLVQVGRLARVFGGMIPGLDVRAITAELRERIVEELDYSLEAEAQQAFADAFRDSPDFAIPEPVHGTATVLVSEWLEGRPLSGVIVEGTKEERDHAGQLYLRFMFAGPATASLLHADPHPGNFRITPDGRLGVLDYGAVNRLPEGLPTSIGRLLAIALDGRADQVLDGLRDEGFVKPTMRLDAQELLDYLDPFVEPARHDAFTFSRAWLRAEAARISDPRREGFSLALKLNLPPSYVLIHRVWMGGIGVLCQLEAEVSTRPEMERWLPGFAEA
jgi:predicted unusual protein kinase regulating ubiquinone biosynthesis (AarF/ABC1/UbiB family)